MDFSYMPYDTQLCNLKVLGFSHAPSEVKLQFPDGRDEFNGLHGPVRHVCPEGGSVEWQHVNLNGTIDHGHSVSMNPDNRWINYTFLFTRHPSYYKSFAARLHVVADHSSRALLKGSKGPARQSGWRGLLAYAHG